MGTTVPEIVLARKQGAAGLRDRGAPRHDPVGSIIGFGWTASVRVVVALVVAVAVVCGGQVGCGVRKELVGPLVGMELSAHGVMALAWLIRAGHGVGNNTGEAERQSGTQDEGTKQHRPALPGQRPP